MPNIKILESIHHGNYRSKRVIELYALTERTVEGVLTSSAYGYMPNPGQALDVLNNLLGQGAAQYGWSNFEVLTDEHEELGAKTFEAPAKRTWEVFFLLHRGPGIEPYRTNAIHYAATAEDAVRMAEDSTKSDCTYRWSQCEVVGVMPSAALDALTYEARKAFKDAMWGGR